MVSESDSPRARPASPWTALESGQPDGWFDYAAAWFDEANRAFAAWYAWWQAAYGIAPGVVPLAGGLNAWWWSSQNALPFAGVV
jgi:hypothetical protein